MELIIGIIVLVIIGWIVKKLLPIIWFLVLFIGALFVLLMWQGVLEGSGLGIILWLGGAFAAAWKFAKGKRKKDSN